MDAGYSCKLALFQKNSFLQDIKGKDFVKFAIFLAQMEHCYSWEVVVCPNSKYMEPVPEIFPDEKNISLFRHIPPGVYSITLTVTRHSEKYGKIMRMKVKDTKGVSFDVWSPPCLTEFHDFLSENNIEGTTEFVKE